MRTRTFATAMAVGVMVVAGCGPKTNDFKREAERLIESDNAARLPMDYDAASCEPPVSMETGTTFTCSAVGTDGASYLFETKITGGRKFVVTLNAAG